MLTILGRLKSWVKIMFRSMLLGYLLLSLSVVVMGAVGLTDTCHKGIAFGAYTSWSQVLNEAKAENKFIFIDCYATWCTPCKEMENVVFANDSVGRIINSDFIAIKVQFDTGQNDNESVRKMSALAHYISQSYNVNSFPTYLFFSPEGSILHKDVGAKSVKKFMEMVECATIPDSQYYRQLAKFKNGQVSCKDLAALASFSLQLGDRKLAFEIARDYVGNYLNGLSEDQFHSKEYLDFLSTFYSVIHLSDNVFRYFCDCQKVIDSVMAGRGFSERIIKYVIDRETIEPIIETEKAVGLTPNWRLIRRVLKAKYNGEFINCTLDAAEAKWYLGMKDWKKYVKFKIPEVNHYLSENLMSGVQAEIYFNNSAWMIFLHSKKKSELLQALTWINYVDRMDVNMPGIMDTKANLLYKLGKSKEGIALEEKVAKADSFSKATVEILEKMRAGRPTWPVAK
jgi:thioredoxin-related protein